jgi:hypothetical protein
LKGLGCEWERENNLKKKKLNCEATFLKFLKTLGKFLAWPGNLSKVGKNFGKGRSGLATFLKFFQTLGKFLVWPGHFSKVPSNFRKVLSMAWQLFQSRKELWKRA